jgi:hypothetical protein
MPSLWAAEPTSWCCWVVQPTRRAAARETRRESRRRCDELLAAFRRHRPGPRRRRPGTTEIVAESNPRARWAKSFSNLGYHDLEDDPRPSGAADRRAIVVIGDGPQAAAVVCRPHRPTRLRPRHRRAADPRTAAAARRRRSWILNARSPGDISRPRRPGARRSGSGTCRRRSWPGSPGRPSPYPGDGLQQLRLVRPRPAGGGDDHVRLGQRGLHQRDAVQHAAQPGERDPRRDVGEAAHDRRQHLSGLSRATVSRRHRASGAFLSERAAIKIAMGHRPVNSLRFPLPGSALRAENGARPPVDVVFPWSVEAVE